MDERYLIAAAANVKLNSVKAKMVSEARDFHWSSVHARIAGTNDGIADVEPLFENSWGMENENEMFNRKLLYVELNSIHY